MGRPDKRKAARDSQFVRKKKRIPWNKPIAGAMSASQNYNYLNRTRADFIIKQIRLSNMNTIRACITITMEMTLMKRAVKVTITLILKVTVILIAKVTGTDKTKKTLIRKF